MTMARDPLARRFGVACMLAAFLAAIVLAATGAGEARGAYQSEPFWATFSATKTVSWSEPKWTTRQDCWHSWWTQASGRQKESYRSTMPVKVLAYSNNGYTFFKWRTWDPYAESAQRRMPADLTLTRSATRATDWDAGTCGVRGIIIDDEGNERSTPVPPPAQDCGTRKAGVDGWLGVKSVWLELFVESSVPSQDRVQRYDDCELHVPEKMTELNWSGEVLARWSPNQFYRSKRGTLTYTARESYRDWIPLGGGAGRLNRSGTVTWTVTLRRVRGGRRVGRYR
jgi:hypothetical protein